MAISGRPRNNSATTPARPPVSTCPDSLAGHQHRFEEGKALPPHPVRSGDQGWFRARRPPRRAHGLRPGIVAIEDWAKRLEKSLRSHATSRARPPSPQSEWRAPRSSTPALPSKQAADFSSSGRGPDPGRYGLSRHRSAVGSPTSRRPRPWGWPKLPRAPPSFSAASPWHCLRAGPAHGHEVAKVRALNWSGVKFPVTRPAR